jgi:hypothetical protein
MAANAAQDCVRAHAAPFVDDGASIEAAAIPFNRIRNRHAVRVETFSAPFRVAENKKIEGE